MMKAIWSLFRRKNTLNGVPIECAAGSSPATQYVNMLLYGMFQNGVGSRILRRSEPLLPLAAPGSALQPPPLDAVVNRIKVMAGLNPVIYSTPAEGTIRLTIGETECRVFCRFDDSTDDRCTVRMESKETAQPPAARVAPAPQPEPGRPMRQ